MPKDTKNLLEVQQQRFRIKEKSFKYTPANVYVQVIGHGAPGESRSVFLCTDHCNYMFNCGEGTQRLAAEHHAKLAKVENIFITRPTWNNIGGLPGVALTVQETGVPLINVHGPEELTGMIESTENFVKLIVKPYDISKVFKDQTMTVSYILMQKPNNRTDSDKNDFDTVEVENFYNCWIKNARKRPHSPNDSNESNFLKKKSLTDDLLAFVCKLEKKAGTLNVQKCNQLGVPSGPLLGKLKAGEDVTLADGTIVKSKDVVGESDKGPLFIVLECPDEDWMNIITENSDFASYQKPLNKDEVTCMIHFTEEKIINNIKYKEWMKKFGSNTMHMVINEKNSGYSSDAMCKMQHQLHMIHSDVFPLFENNDFDEKNLDTYNVNSEKCNDLDLNLLKEKLKVRRCKVMDHFNLRPKKGLDTEKNIKIDSNLYVQETLEIDGLSKSLAGLKEEIKSMTKNLGDELEEYPRLVMLGTGSSIPNKVRNTSGILLQIDEETSILLDCGEATFNQIVRLFGKTKADKILKSIKAIYISHLHADHHIGLIGILEQRKILTNNHVYLFAPDLIILYLSYYSNRINNILQNFTLISNKKILMNQTILKDDELKEIMNYLNILKINTVDVDHCLFPYGVAVTLKDGKKICYSGDTRPCDKLQELARDGFLLIHEATMEDALEAEAVVKRHSTVSQAVNTGEKAGVNFTLLTHFSQRYCKLPVLPDRKESGHDYSRVGIAYDFMIISLSRLLLLPLFYPTLAVMFNEFREELYQKTKNANMKNNVSNLSIT